MTPDGSNAGDAPLSVAVFQVGDKEFCTDVAAVREIVRPEGLTRVPRAAEEIVGVMNLRGQILAVLDLRKRLGFDVGTRGPEQRVLVIDHGDAPPIGMLVDQVLEVLRVKPDAYEARPEIVGGASYEAYLNGFIKHEKRIILVCDLGRLAKPPQMANVRTDGDAK